MATVTSPQTRFPSNELSSQGHSLSVNAGGIPLPAQGNPGVVFCELFEERQGGVARQRRGLKRSGSILDAIIDEAATLDRQLGNADKGRLEHYLTSVREVELRTQRADKWLDVPRPTGATADRSRVNRSISLEHLGDYLCCTMYGIIALAFQTDLTRAATFSTRNENLRVTLPLGLKVRMAKRNGSDGDRQFLCGTTNSSEECRLVCLHEVVESHPAVSELADLPMGRSAIRDAPDQPWQRMMS